MLGMVSMRAYRVADGPTVVGFLHNEVWPFHAGPTATLAEAVERFDSAGYASDAVETWRLDDEGKAVGLVRLFDLCDDTAMFDIRISEVHRRRGVGTSAVRWLTGHVFTSRACTRIEATTRRDNVAMRRVLLRCGYAKEAHYRSAWPAGDGDDLHDAVGYAILDKDWRTGTVTPVVWDDEPEHRGVFT